MNYLLNLIIVIFFPILTFGQFNKYEHPDKLFKNYKSPVIDSKIYDRLETDDAIVYFGCYFTTDTAGIITSEKYIPLSGIGNDYALSDSVWQALINAITTASKKWVFKPILWKLNGDKKAEVNINHKPFQRPFTGRPRYFMIVEISGVPGVSSIDKISFIKNFTIGR
ncbi:hypothetical protein [Longitalea arenae]|uniref:hypothetical protein n=1 Tax=Longitalea arenae TaxID=2812558 RepID=UPI0019674494|nr:hypothetical protein [Longitalea arenae]